MATCNKCGKTYLTKECVSCRDTHYKDNKETIKGVHSKEIKYLWKITFLILLISSILIIIVAFLKIQDLENINNTNYQKIDKLKIKNQQLERRNNINKRLIESHTKQIREMTYQLRNRGSAHTLNTRHIQPKKKNISKRNQTKIRYSNSSHAAKQNFKSNAYKKYNNYTGYEKLISDSSISKRSDNRLKSNAPIYGIYKRPILLSINCGNNPKIYKIRNECSTLEPYSMDKLYFNKSNINELKFFNTKTHKIECKYNQEHGLMHDCRAKIFKYEYK